MSTPREVSARMNRLGARWNCAAQDLTAACDDSVEILLALMLDITVPVMLPPGNCGRDQGIIAPLCDKLRNIHVW